MVQTCKQTGALALALFLAVAFAACNSNKDTAASPPATTIEMKMDANYSDSDPFSNARLFAVTESVDQLVCTVSCEMQGESGLVEIADNETGHVFWSMAWNGSEDNGAFTVSLTNMDKESEYVIRFTGTGIEQAEIVATFESDLVVERERPQARA